MFNFSDPYVLRGLLRRLGYSNIELEMKFIQEHEGFMARLESQLIEAYNCSKGKSIRSHEGREPSVEESFNHIFYKWGGCDSCRSRVRHWYNREKAKFEPVEA